MRLIVMFDLPIVLEEDKKNYIHFRNFLLDDGYVMMQFSIYSRICKNRDDCEKHIRRIRTRVPSKGNVRLLQVTEKQYHDMILLCGSRSEEESFSVTPLISFD